MPQTDAAASWPNYCEDDFVIEDYRFASGELMPELRLHYRTMGVPRRNAAGEIVNGVLLLQGNTGTGANWLRPSLADETHREGRPQSRRPNPEPATSCYYWSWRGLHRRTTPDRLGFSTRRLRHL